jgi:hypothetical protein
MMREGSSPVLVRREDYTAPSHWIRSVDLTFDLDPAKTLVINRMRVEPNADRPGEPLRLDGEAITLTRVLVNGESVSFRNEGGQLVLDKLPGETFDLEIRRLLHPVRGRGLPPHHLLPGPPGRDGGLHGHAQGRCQGLPGAAVQRQPGRIKGRLDNGRHFAVWARPLPQAQLPVRAGGRRPGLPRAAHPHRSGRDHLLQVYVRAGDLDKTEHAMHSLVASIAWDEARFGLPLDLERFMIVACERLQHGRDGEQGPEHLQHEVRAGQPRHRHRRRLRQRRGVVGARVLPQLDRQPHHLPRLVPAQPEGRPDRLPRPGVQHGHGRQRVAPRRARSSASRTCASCAPCSSPRTPARWRTRCGPTATARSTTSTPPPSTKRAPRWCA